MKSQSGHFTKSAGKRDDWAEIQICSLDKKRGTDTLNQTKSDGMKLSRCINIIKCCP